MGDNGKSNLSLEVEFNELLPVALAVKTTNKSKKNKKNNLNCTRDTSAYKLTGNVFNCNDSDKHLQKIMQNLKC